MRRFMIEVDHDDKIGACTRTLQVFLATGSHFLTHADWGCLDGVHTSWIVVEAETREQARAILPPALRSQAMIVGLNSFTMEQMDEILARHGGGGAERGDAYELAEEARARAGSAREQLKPAAAG